MKLFGMEVYVYALFFFLFSFFGYILECIVLSVEQRKRITDRGFTHLPICIIYGVGATGALAVLSPISGNVPLLFACSAVSATILEYLTACLMLHLFGDFWWDYKEKRCNYKGMICLESTIGWGMIGVIFFYFLKDFMLRIIEAIPEGVGKGIAVTIFAVYNLDFLYCLYQQFHDRDEEENEELKFSSSWIQKTRFK